MAGPRAEDVSALLTYRDGEPSLYRHSTLSVGFARQDEQAIVVMHATMGEARFEFRFTPENARFIARHMLACADEIAPS
jgi:hypothetical protein